MCNKRKVSDDEASRTSDHMTLIISSAAASLDPELTCFIFTDLLCVVSRNKKKKKKNRRKKA